MAVLDAVMEKRISAAVGSLARRCRLRAAYLFGSTTDGTANAESDIDIAAFIEGVEQWDIQRRVQMAVQLQAELGDDLEFHFFSAEDLTNPPRASFAEYVLRRGMRLDAGG